MAIWRAHLRSGLRSPRPGGHRHEHRETPRVQLRRLEVVEVEAVNSLISPVERWPSFDLDVVGRDWRKVLTLQSESQNRNERVGLKRSVRSSRW